MKVRLADGSLVKTCGQVQVELQLVTKVSKKTRFEVLDCEVESILGMFFLNQFNPEIDWTNCATTIDEFTIYLVYYEASNNNPRLEIISAIAFVKGFQKGKYTQCGYVDSIQTVPQQIS